MAKNKKAEGIKMEIPISGGYDLVNAYNRNSFAAINSDQIYNVNVNIASTTSSLGIVPLAGESFTDFYIRKYGESPLQAAKKEPQNKKNAIVDINDISNIDFLPNYVVENSIKPTIKTQYGYRTKPAKIFYAQDKDESKAISLEDIKEFKYRCILTDHNSIVNYVKCPKDCELTDKQLLEEAYKGNSEIRLVDGLPSNKKSDLSIKSNKKVKKNYKKDYITFEEFCAKTSNLFDIEVSINSLRSYLSGGDLDRRSLLRTADQLNSSCAKNIFVVDNSTMDLGVTTGIYSNKGFEVVSLNYNQGGYTNKHMFKKLFFHTDNITILSNSNHISKFFRIKIINSDKSSETFGSKTRLKKEVGRIIGGNDFRFNNRYVATSDKQHDCLEVVNQARTEYLAFHYDDIKVLMINPNYLQVVNPKLDRTIIKGCQVIIKDDRRLINIKKGDIVKVVSINLNKLKEANSIVNIIDNTGKKQIALLKQLKLYVNNNQKTSEASSKTSIKYSNSKATKTAEEFTDEDISDLF